MNAYVLGFQEIDKTMLAVVGGKGANLGELFGIEGIKVPEGFCVTTAAYQKTIRQTPELPELMEQLVRVQGEDRKSVAAVSSQIRRAIEGTAIPEEIAAAVAQQLTKLGENEAYAVRSSATAEDLPTSSFAGQQDTYLNIIGREAVLSHISKCWASLFTDRAVIYRLQNGFDHNKVHLSVVIQKMVFPEAAGILFTADPITGNRKITSIDASFGLGEALVSGLVNPDIYKVRDGKVIDKKVATKKLAIYALKEGGTEEREIEAENQNGQTLTDGQILELADMGRRIEAYFGRPQDIEWCLDNHQFYIVQSRPITSLYPIPEARDGKNHVYISFSHQQMMTDAMKPLGLSFFEQGFENKAKKSKPVGNSINNSQDNTQGKMLIHAGGRLFFDLAQDLASPARRKIALAAMGKIDPLVLNALKRLLKRKDFLQSLGREGKGFFSMGTGYFSLALPIQAIKIYRHNDPGFVQSLMSRNEAAVKELRQKITDLSGEELFAFISEALKQLQGILNNPQDIGVVYVGAYALNWLNKNMEKWLGEKSAADALAKSVPYNVTSEMGLALLDVADVVRQYPAVLAYLPQAKDETLWADLARLEGGAVVSQTIQEYLEKYGMRCSGEIDITRPRWSEQPTALIPTILGNIKNFAPGAHKALLEQGLQEARQKEQDLLKRLEQLPGGKAKAKKAKRMISVLRNFVGYREYPKYVMVGYYWVIKQALLKEAAKLMQKGVTRERADIYYLSLEEFREAVGTNRLDYSVITKRKEEYEVYEKLTPPRVLTSEGEIISGEYESDNIPQGALAGIPVSAGIVEGRARIILKMEDADIEEGDVLVTPFTDPSWTPLFVSVKGLVTEVGGMMTHGAVVAREYGLPAVVGVEGATKRIKDGQRIRVNGAEGYVEVL
jgi:pyruvate,water dikinase